jgi:hypothetical protein
MKFNHYLVDRQGWAYMVWLDNLSCVLVRTKYIGGE